MSAATFDPAEFATLLSAVFPCVGHATVDPTPDPGQPPPISRFVISTQGEDVAKVPPIGGCVILVLDPGVIFSRLEQAPVQRSAQVVLDFLVAHGILELLAARRLAVEPYCVARVAADGTVTWS